MAGKRVESSDKRYTCIEGFAGAGGMAIGIKAAGFSVPVAFDYDNWAVSTYRRNLGDAIIEADARELSGKELLKKAGVKKGELDLFSGGPPCQGFSKQRRGAHSVIDERNRLVLEYARLVHEMAPRFFLLENVAMLGQKRGKAFVEGMIDLLGDEYSIYSDFFNSADYGVAQTRQRYIVIGKRRDIEAKFKFPGATVKKWNTVGDALKGLPEPPEDYTDHSKYPNHQRARVTEINIKRFSYVPQGGGWQDIPYKLRIKCHQVADVKSGGWPDVYGRLRVDGQCPTITAGFDSFTRGRYGHPLHNRPLTPREAARLQGFPDDFVFLGSRADIRLQIGNAVPPPLAEAVSSAIRKALLVEDGLESFDMTESFSEPLQSQLVLAL